MGCGYYVNDYQDPQEPRPRGRRLRRRRWSARSCDGAWGTDVRAGMIGEIGCQAPWTAHGEAGDAGRAASPQRETGAAINVHPGRHPDQPQEVADFVKAAGQPTDRVVISHIDRTVFDERAAAAARGHRA